MRHADTPSAARLDEPDANRTDKFIRVTGLMAGLVASARRANWSRNRMTTMVECPKPIPPQPTSPTPTC